MSVMVVIDDGLRAKIAREISQMAHSHPRSSLAADVLDFDAVVDGVCKLIDLEATEDFETAVIVAMARLKARTPAYFVPRRKNPFSLSLWKKTT